MADWDDVDLGLELICLCCFKKQMEGYLADGPDGAFYCSHACLRAHDYDPALAFDTRSELGDG